MDFIIRKAVPEDFRRILPLQEQISRLHHEGRPDLFKDEVRVYSEDTFRSWLDSPTHVPLIAEVEGEVAGYAFSWVIQYRDHPTYKDFDSFYIDDICVLDKFRRHGIGRVLMACCVEEAKKRGCKNVELGVWSFNKDAIAFYESCSMTERVKRMEIRLEG